MPVIVLNAEQARNFREVGEAIEIRDEQGTTLARVLSPSDEAVVAEARRRLQSGNPCYPSSEVLARLRRLEEISQRKELDGPGVKELIRRMRAGEEV